MKKISSIAIILCAMSLLAKERITITVTDPAGNPVSNATVEVKTMNKLIVFGSDREADFDTHYVTTDAKGRAELRFNCITRCFSWGATAEGYYDGKWTREEFDGSETISPLGKIAIAFKEHEKELTTTLWPKKNPQPMHARWLCPALRLPTEQGRFGFDFQEGDWVAPLGRGAVADMFYVREGESQSIELPGGGYIEKMTAGHSFLAAYCADTNREFVTRIPLRKKLDGVVPIQIAIDTNEYLVVRTRVVKDGAGKVVQANYAEILGQMEFTDEMCFMLIIFNPRPNDLNLEWDCVTNLSKPRRE